MKKLPLLLLLALAALGSGCASTGYLKAYPGPERPGDQLATIVLPASIEVRSINGQKQPIIAGTLLKPVYTIATLPGPQDWNIRYSTPLAGGYYNQQNEMTESPWTQFQFQTEAGGVYHLNVVTPREVSPLQNGKGKVHFNVSVEQKAVRSPQPATSPPQAAEPSPALVVSPPPKHAPQTLENAAFEQLKGWWSVAGPHERQTFRDWLKTQP